MPPLVTLTIDTEEEWDWHAGFPVTGYGVENIQALGAFQELCDRYGIATTYFTDYAVMADAGARAVVQTLAQNARVEIGLHIHPWNTPPLTHVGPVQPRETFLHNLPDEVVFAKLQSVYDRFVEAGLRPTSFRGGRYSTSPTIQRWLCDHQIIADASVVPFTTWGDEGAPDYRNRTPEPVRRADSMLWEIPLTRGFTRQPFWLWQRCYDSVEHSFLRKLRLIGVVEKLGIVRKLWLNFEQHSTDELLALLLALRDTELPCVCLTLHSSSLRAGMSPYTRTSDDEARLRSRLTTVLGRLRDWGYQPATVSDVARHLESRHARARHQPAG